MPGADSELEALLLKAIAGSLLLDERRLFTNALLSTPWQVKAFQITPETVVSVVKQRLQNLQACYPRLHRLCQQLGWRDCPVSLLWWLWLPLAEQIATWRKLFQRPLIQGILGVQGTGKTTLALILQEILTELGFQVCCLSLDDLYKTYQERQQLQAQDPRFRWRGPPGTHDLELGLTVLHQLRQAQFPVALPRFDKSAYAGVGERAEPVWIGAAEIVLFEGWFVGVRPIPPQAFETAPPPITTAADRDFAREVNQRLQDYLLLWEQIDRLIVLSPSDYRFSQTWRRQAEQQMIAHGQSGMSDAEISDFVTYFWRALHPDLFVQPVLHNPDYVDLVIEIDADHRPGLIYRPQVLH
jgi:D-glycerate 3-kinase